MFTREDAFSALKDFYGRNFSDISGLHYLGSVQEPDGLIEYCFEVTTSDFEYDVSVYCDDYGINIMEW